MAVKCKNGHWYDPNVFRSCPHCKEKNETLSLMVDNVEEDDKTVSIMDADLSLGEQLGEIVQENIGGEIPMDALGEFSDDDKTVSFGFFGMAGVQPVTGWLVCQTGEERGKDYRLHAGKNFIGRSNTMDVVLIDDKTIARNKHASVTYDPKGNTFYVTPEGGNTVYVAGELAGEAVKLSAGDVITIGKTELVFIPYCEEERKWQE